ncbi:MAG: hypothetical protein IJX38_05265 [Clostridia bacterium]|nr:hypothetical protein [Clostridia bacterium]
MDMERYGDYNEVDEPKSKSKFFLIMKILIFAVCFLVVGVIVFRLILFNYYPDNIEKLQYTEALREYYYGNDGNMTVETQTLRAPYDDENEGNFMADNLLVVRDAGHLQLSIRYNNALYATLAEKGIDLNEDPSRRFTFRLVRDPVDNSDEAAVPEPIGTYSDCFAEEFMMYTYFKVMFDGIDFEGVEWIRLDIYVDGAEEPFSIPVYENNEGYRSFDEYKLSKEEVPG